MFGCFDKSSNLTCLLCLGSTPTSILGVGEVGARSVGFDLGHLLLSSIRFSFLVPNSQLFLSFGVEETKGHVVVMNFVAFFEFTGSK